MADTNITVIVLNWNSCERTILCIRNLLQGMSPRIQIMLIDNGSSDGSGQAFRTAFTAHEITLLCLDKNYGFSSGVNRGIRHVLQNSQPDYILLLNNDTNATSEIITQLADHMDRKPRVGIATPKIVYSDTPEILWGIGGKMQPHWFTVNGMGERDVGQYTSFQPDFVFGCAMMIRRTVLEKIGLLDERFFFSYEDIDFCLRAAAVGFGITYYPEIVISHDGSASTHHQSYLREYYMAHSRLKFFKKWSYGLNFVRFLARESLYFGSTLWRCLWCRDWLTLRWYVSGWIEGLL